MAKVSDFDALVAATNATREEGETDNQFFTKIAVAVADLDEEAWNALPASARNWYNDQASLIEVAQKKEEEAVLTAPAGFAKEGEGEAKTPARRGRKPGSSNKPKEPKEEKPKSEKTPPAADAVREIIAADISISLDALMKALEDRGIQMQRSSAQVVHLNTVRAAQMFERVGTVFNNGKKILAAAE